MSEEETQRFVELRKTAEVLIAALVETIDPHCVLDDITCLLCAAGAACGDLELAEELIDAVSPIMERAYKRIKAMENN